MYLVDVATSADAAKVSDLRRTALSASRGFSLHDIRKVDWCDIDESSVVFVVRENDSIVSTVRMIIFSDTVPAERFMEYAVTRHPIPGPILVMSRAATLSSHAGKGLMGAIRYAYLSVMPQTGIESVISVVYDGAPRVNSIKRARFELLKCDEYWDSEATVTTQPYICVLRKALFPQALAHTRSEFAQAIGACEFNWDAIRQRFDRAPIHSNWQPAAVAARPGDRAPRRVSSL